MIREQFVMICTSDGHSEITIEPFHINEPAKDRHVEFILRVTEDSDGATIHLTKEQVEQILLDIPKLLELGEQYKLKRLIKDK